MLGHFGLAKYETQHHAPYFNLQIRDGQDFLNLTQYNVRDIIDLNREKINGVFIDDNNCLNITGNIAPIKSFAEIQDILAKIAKNIVRTSPPKTYDQLYYNIKARDKEIAQNRNEHPYYHKPYTFSLPANNSFVTRLIECGAKSPKKNPFAGLVRQTTLPSEKLSEANGAESEHKISLYEYEAFTFGNLTEMILADSKVRFYPPDEMPRYRMSTNY